MRFSSLALSLGLSLALTSGCSLALSDVRCDQLTRPVPDDPEVRVVKTRIIEHTAWELSPGRDADELVAETSELWEREFGIRFEIVARESVAALPMLMTVGRWHQEAEEQRFHGDEELIVIFSRSSGINPETAGILAGLLIVAPGPLDSGYHLLNHGLGHVFGLGHDARLGSFMDVNPIASAPGIAAVFRTGFTDRSKGTIKQNKWCSFRPDRPFYPRPVETFDDEWTAAVERPIS